MPDTHPIKLPQVVIAGLIAMGLFPLLRSDGAAPDGAAGRRAIEPASIQPASDEYTASWRSPSKVAAEQRPLLATDIDEPKSIAELIASPAAPPPAPSIGLLAAISANRPVPVDSHASFRLTADGLAGEADARRVWEDPRDRGFLESGFKVTYPIDSDFSFFAGFGSWQSADPDLGRQGLFAKVGVSISF